jgi:hypothetical protein
MARGRGWGVRGHRDALVGGLGRAWGGREGGRRREAVTAAVWWRGEQCSGEGEAQGDGGIASGGPGTASYREEKGEERRMAGRHGGGVTAELGGGAVRVVARGEATGAG